MAVSVLVVGGGKVGGRLASLLVRGGHRVTVIEPAAEEIEKLAKQLPEATLIRGSGTDPLVLESAQIRATDVLAAVTGSDETNLVATSLSRFEFKVKRTIARVKDPRNAWMFTAVMGVDVSVNQADLMAHLIAGEVSLDKVLTLLKFTRGNYVLIEEKVEAAAKAAGRAVEELDLPAECLLTGIIRAGEFLLPRGKTILQPGDEVLAVVHADKLSGLSAALSMSRPPS